MSSFPSSAVSSPEPYSDFAELRSRKRELLAEQKNRWSEGDPPPVDELLERWPTDPQGDADVASLLMQDMLQRRMHGEEASQDEYSRRFPKHKDSLAGLVSRHDFLRSVGVESTEKRCTLRFPEVGDEVFGFRLCEELGRGAFARVFLAEQAELGARAVAVKISAIEGTEPQTLAQMQHTHIVPIYSVQEDSRSGLRAVCMPYFGGASLSRILQQVWAKTKLPLEGRQFVASLEKIAAPTPSRGRNQPAGIKRQQAAPAPVGTFSLEADEATVVTPVSPHLLANDSRPLTPGSPPMPLGDGQTPLALLRGESYVRAAIWIVARLAEGLQHAHQRRVLHRDIKPANILVGADGQPMLLDFNLSQDQNQDAAAAILGGTVAYMAPEHLRAMARRTAPLVNQVDHRADIYSLGMVLYEMLTGHKPFDQSASYSVLPLQIEAMAAERSKSAPSLRSQRRDAPWSLESIVCKCLAPNPADRYQQAEHFAEDLRCVLDHRPLRHAPELSRVERAVKWTRRHPRLTSTGAVTLMSAILLLATGSALVTAHQHLTGTKEKLVSVQAQERKRNYEAGTMRALCLVNTTTGLQEHLPKGMTVCEETLALYGILSADVWQEPADWLQLSTENRNRLAEDARELLLLLASARVRVASKDHSVVRQALTLLDRAEAIPGLALSRALWLDRARYLALLGETPQSQKVQQRAEEIPVVSARDHYLLATALVRAGGPENYAMALAALDRAVILDHRHYWSRMQRGICYTDLGEHLLAAGDFGHCTGLWPEFAWGHFNLGFVQAQSGKKSEAVSSYTKAIECDPDLLAARVNRGLSRLELKKYQGALDDYDRALAQGKTDASVQAGRGMALEGLRRHAEADTAFQLAFAQTATLPVPTRLQIRWSYGFAVASRLPVEAEKAFAEVLTLDPQNTPSLYGSAMLAMERGKNPEALGFFNRALEVSPNYFDARRYRAVLLARNGALEQASEDINWCLEKEPHSGDTLYAAACVAALAAKKHADSKLKDQALSFLEKALGRGVGSDKADNDPDLAWIRQNLRFREIIAQANGSKATGK